MTSQLWAARDQIPPGLWRFAPPYRPYAPVKPLGGLWTSTPDEPENWLGWLKAEGYGDRPAREGDMFSVTQLWLLEPSPGARVYEIDAYEDLERLVAEFPDREPIFEGAGWYKVDWQAVAGAYDGVHLSAEGQWRTRGMDFGAIERPFDSPNLYGWDCESTLWLRWCFDRRRRFPDGRWEGCRGVPTPRPLNMRR